MFHLLAVQSFLAGIGIMLVILAVVLFFIKGYRKDGILILFLSNLPIWSAILYPNSLSKLCIHLGASPNFLDRDLLFFGIGIGFFICSMIFICLQKLHKSLSKKVNGGSQDDEESTMGNNNGSTYNGTESSLKTKEQLSYEYKRTSSDYVNPEVFSAIRKNRNITK